MAKLIFVYFKLSAFCKSKTVSLCERESKKNSKRVQKKKKSEWPEWPKRSIFISQSHHQLLSIMCSSFNCTSLLLHDSHWRMSINKVQIKKWYHISATLNSDINKNKDLVVTLKLFSQQCERVKQNGGLSLLGSQAVFRRLKNEQKGRITFQNQNSLTS